MANPMTVLPQAPSKIQSERGQALTSPSLKGSAKSGEQEALSNEFELTLKQGLEEVETKDAEERAGELNVAVPGTASNVLTTKAQNSELLEGKSNGLASKANLFEGKAADLDARMDAAQLQKSVADPKLAQEILKAAKSQDEQLQTQVKLQGEKSASPEGVPAAILQSMLGEGVDTSGLDSFDHEFQVEVLEIKDGVSPKAEGKESTSASKLSTSDYLSLRDLGKKPNENLDLGTSGKPALKKEKLVNLVNQDSKEGAGIASALPQTFQVHGHAKVVEANTTQGTAGKTVLAHEAVQQLSGQVNLLSQARQDGEIKIRLRPDHLGELMMNVKTQGQQVAIQIKAHDGESKKIIEESLGALRDSLSQQNLSLSQVEVVTQPSQEQTAQFDMGGQRQDFGQGSQGFRDDQQNQNARQDRLYEEPRSAGNLNLARTNRAVRSSSSQGLDLIA